LVGSFLVELDEDDDELGGGLDGQLELDKELDRLDEGLGGLRGLGLDRDGEGDEVGLNEVGLSDALRSGGSSSNSLSSFGVSP
ncbi:hypothetical protein NL676_023735, partial [Syzygium grande]